jgi:transposase
LARREATTASMGVFLAAFARELEPGARAVLVLDRAGWHGSPRLEVAANVTLVPLPPYSPELVWGFACQALRIAAPPFRPLGSV